MSKLLRLRVALTDRPGALAQVAAIIAGHGGNITSVDVHRAARSAIDDLVVEFRQDPDPARLGDDLARSGVATLVAHQETRAADPIVASFERLAAILGCPPEDPAASLAEWVGELCGSPAVWVSAAEGALGHEAGRLAVQTDGPLVLPSTQLPEHLAGRLPGPVCVLAVPEPERGAGGLVVFVARVAGSDFTATEVARIEALMALHARIELLPGRA